LIGSHDGRLKHIQACDGTLLWETNLKVVIFGAPFVTTECVVVGLTSGEICVLSLKTGVLLNKIKLNGEIYSSPVVVGDKIYVGCRDDCVYCIQM
jgi:acyl-CoA synthetase